jgi:phosphopantetheinyl transferase
LCGLEQSLPLLSDWERGRAATFTDAAQAQEWLAAHIALRVVLERVLGNAARGVTFARAAGGKPRLEGAPIAFSLSHIPGLALIALARDGIVGVDVEWTHAVRVREPRRARIEAAGAAINPSDPLPAGADARFLQAWVRLEAFAKAEGCGVGRLLTRLGINSARAGREEDFRFRIEGVMAETQIASRDVVLGEGLFAAVAAAPMRAVPEVFTLPASKSALQKLLA